MNDRRQQVVIPLIQPNSKVFLSQHLWPQPNSRDGDCPGASCLFSSGRLRDDVCTILMSQPDGNDEHEQRPRAWHFTGRSKLRSVGGLGGTWRCQFYSQADHARLSNGPNFGYKTRVLGWCSNPRSPPTNISQSPLPCTDYPICVPSFWLRSLSLLQVRYPSIYVTPRGSLIDFGPQSPPPSSNNVLHSTRLPPPWSRGRRSSTQVPSLTRLVKHP
jgi:hypothetical protein